jgi:hypothetical protein
VDVGSVNWIYEHYHGRTTNKIIRLNKTNSDGGLTRVPV